MHRISTLVFVLSLFLLLIGGAFLGFEQEGSSSKHRVERCPTVKDVLTYIELSGEAARRKAAFFEL